ncbi:MAG: hypothetical protein ACYTFT_12025 [Planctomycetota bacterium]|jgi:tetratricopeptide (TPR) repeat protein
MKTTHASFLAISLIAALLLALPPRARADEAREAWDEVATWIRDNQPTKRTKGAITKYQKDCAKRLEGFLDEHGDSGRLAIEAEQALGETYLLLGRTKEALKLYEPMAKDEESVRRAKIGRYGVIKTLRDMGKLAEARKRLDAFLEASPDDADLQGYDETLKEDEATAAAKKAFKSLRKGHTFPPLEGTFMSNITWSLEDEEAPLVLIGFYLAQQPNGTRMPKSALAEARLAKKLYAKYAEDGLQVIGVAIDREPKRLSEFLGSEQLGYPHLMEGDAIARSIGLETIPMWVLVNADRKILGWDLRKSDLEKTVKKQIKKLK